MAPGATTHGFDMNQRYVKLRVLDTVDGKGVDVVAPPSPSVAPPGYYMLFLINKQGVPSVASWVKVDAEAPDQPLIGSPPAGDFNGDGFPDLAIAAPGESVGSATGAGDVHVVYGSGSGLGSGSSQTWTQNDLGGGEGAAAGNMFGAALAAGDFNGDGYAELAIGAPGEDVGSNGDAGAVHILYGSADGLAASGEQTLTQGSDGIADRAEARRFVRDRAGSGRPQRRWQRRPRGRCPLGGGRHGRRRRCGERHLRLRRRPGRGRQPALDPEQRRHQRQSGSGDSFGTALAAGDLNGDGSADLAVGAPSEGVGTAAGAGAVNVIYGSGGGLTAAGNQLWTEDSPSVNGMAEPDASGSPDPATHGRSARRSRSACIRVNARTWSPPRRSSPTRRTARCRTSASSPRPRRTRSTTRT
jgi:hypothetical protein